MLRLWLVIFCILWLCLSESTAFVTTRRTPSLAVVGSVINLKAESSNKEKDQAATTVDPVTKGAWYAVETFGKIFGKQVQAANGDASTLAHSVDNPPRSMQETMARLKADNDREYFLSGAIDKLIYDEDCEFADPFVSFKGRDRFIDNLENLSSFIAEYSARPLGYHEIPEENAVESKFMVKLQLNLPWKPVLAWPWGVRCEIDPLTNLILLHRESWDVDALEGVKQIFRKPTTSVK